MERTTIGNFLESLSAKGSREMGHWLEGNRGIKGGFGLNMEDTKVGLHADGNDL